MARPTFNDMYTSGITLFKDWRAWVISVLNDSADYSEEVVQVHESSHAPNDAQANETSADVNTHGHSSEIEAAISASGGGSYDDTAIQAAVALNTAKVTNVAHPLVETAVPVGALFTDTDNDTIYDDTAIQAAVALNTAKETNTDTQNTGLEAIAKIDGELGTDWKTGGAGSVAGDQPIIRLSSTSAQTFTQAAPVIVTWDNETEKDVGLSHSNVVNNQRITVDTDGTYLIGGNIRVIEDADQRAQYVTQILVNGIALPTKYGSSYIRNSGFSSDYWTCATGIVPLKLLAGDYLEIRIGIESQAVTTFASTIVGAESDFYVIAATGEKGASGLTPWSGSQVAYDALGSYDSNQTYYII